MEIGSPVAPHQERRSTDYAVQAALAAAGYPRSDRYHLRDMRHELRHLLWHIIAEYDVVLIIGGTAKRRFNYLPRVLDELGVKKQVQIGSERQEQLFWFGLSQRNTPVFALPGDPISCYVQLHRQVIPALTKMDGVCQESRQFAVIKRQLKKPVSWPEGFMLVKVEQGPSGEILAEPSPVQTPHDFWGIVGTDGFVEVSSAKTIPEGKAMRFWSWV